MKNSKFRPAAEFTALPTPAERKASKAMVAKIIAEQRTLAELRKGGEMTQAKVGLKLKISQDQVSRLEKRTDILLSTLNKYVGAIGGRVRIMVEMPGKPPVELADLVRGAKPSPRRRPRAKAA